MKNKISLVILLFCTVNAFSQAESNSIAMSNEFAMLAAHGGTGSNLALKKTFTDLNINIDSYIKEHPGSVDEDYLVSLVMELNR